MEASFSAAPVAPITAYLGHTVLRVDDLEAAVAFYTQWLGEAISFHWQREAHYVEGRLGQAPHERVLAFATQQGLQPYFTVPPLTLPLSRGLLLSLETEAVVTLYQKALQAGATSLAAPKLMPWQQQGRPCQSAFFACPFGVWWELTGPAVVT